MRQMTKEMIRHIHPKIYTERFEQSTARHNALQRNGIRRQSDLLQHPEPRH